MLFRSEIYLSFLTLRRSPCFSIPDPNLTRRSRRHHHDQNRTERRNAVDAGTAQALYEAFLAFGANASASVAILTGAGEHFCSGANLNFSRKFRVLRGFSVFRGHHINCIFAINKGATKKEN